MSWALVMKELIYSSTTCKTRRDWNTGHRRRDSHCYFADFKIRESSHCLLFATFSITSGQSKLEHFSSRKQDRYSWRGASLRGAAAEGRHQVHTLPLKLTEAGRRPSWQELHSMGTKVWKHRLAKVRRRPCPADNYAKGCVCTGSSK